MTPKLRRSNNVAIDGGKLLAARTAANLTQTQLAHEAGLSQSYISGIEHGDRSRIAPAPHARLIAALGVSDTALQPDDTTP